MSSLMLLKFFSIRENFDSYFEYINLDILPSESAVILRDYERYFQSDTTSAVIDFDKFSALFTVEWHTGYNEAKHDTFRMLINEVSSYPEDKVKDVLPAFLAAECKSKIESVWEKSFDSDAIKEIIEEYENKMSSVRGAEDPDAFTFEDVDLASIQKERGFPWCLAGLQSKLGNLTLGNFTVVCATVGSGKTAFCLTQAAHVFLTLNAKKSKQPILFFNSEGSMHDLWARFITTVLNLTRDPLDRVKIEDLINDYRTYFRDFTSDYDESLFITYDVSGKTSGFVEQKCKIHEPAIVFIDMIDDMGKSKNQNDVIADRMLYHKLRNLSNYHCPIIGTVQAKGSAKVYDKDTHSYTYKRYVDLHEMDFSNVGKQAKADSVVTIGLDSNFPNDRYLNVAKVKRGVAGTIPAVKFTAPYGVYEDFA